MATPTACVAFDIGTRNLAMCRVECSTGTPLITDWTVVDLGMGTLVEQIARLPERFTQLDIFTRDPTDVYVIEMQPPGGGGSVVHGPNRAVSLCVLTYIRTRFPDRQVSFQHAGSTDGAIDLWGIDMETSIVTSRTYLAKKLRATLATVDILSKTEQLKWLDVFNHTVKKDDLADALLHAIWQTRSQWQPHTTTDMNFNFLATSRRRN